MSPNIPGQGMTTYGIFLLAECYHEAADVVLNHHTKALSDHPARLLYLHAIETYFRAFLRMWETNVDNLRAFRHNVGDMADASVAKGLHLDRVILKYLRDVSLENDYVRIRYDYDLRSLSGEWPEPRTRPRSISSLKSAAEIQHAIGTALNDVKE